MSCLTGRNVTGGRGRKKRGSFFYLVQSVALLTCFVKTSANEVLSLALPSFTAQQKLPKFGFLTHTTALHCTSLHFTARPMEQSSILSAKFNCPVARQNLLQTR